MTENPVHGPSRLVLGQTQARLAQVRRRLVRQRAGSWRHPVAPDRVRAIETLLDAARGRPIIADTGCGTGQSTVAIGRANPQAWVLGLDKSLHRLARAQQRVRPDNVGFGRVDLADFWAVARLRGQRFARTYALYPNPWPKVGQLSRRLYGEPAFIALVNLSDAVELRTNWEVYAREFRAALELLTGQRADIETLAVISPWGLTAFEAKYADSGHVLFRVRADLGAG